jgi:two-component sensor histidine kinase/CheY-like chemotaxis protein
MNGVRLLLVDNDKGMGELLHGTLEQLGFGVTLSAGGQDALDRLAADQFDIVALDQTEAGLDGLETLARIQKMPARPPVVFVADSPDSRVATAALKAGATDYVAKDLQCEFIPTLIAAINDAIAMQQMHKARVASEAEVRAARDRFAALAVERAVMLREVNHRVGNSLQLITALLSLQSSASDNPDTKTALSEAMMRVMAVAQLHKRLFTADNQRLLSLDQYLGALVEDLGVTPATRKRATLTLTTEPVALDPDGVLSVGVIANELVADALKHTGPGVGSIRIVLRREGAAAVLTVDDDGVRDGAEVACSTGLSHTILQAMAGKVKARFAVEDLHPGTRVTMTFKPEAA